MSLIRQRTKNLIAAGISGFVIGTIVLGLLGTAVVIKNEAIAAWIMNVMSTRQSKQVEAVEEAKIGVYLLTQPVEKGDLIAQEMLKRVDLVEAIIPSDALKNVQDIINKKAVMHLETNTMLTETLVIEPDLTEVTADLVEISAIHVPEILEVGDLINLRIHFPTGQDYIVLENKEIQVLNVEKETFFVIMDEEEILAYSSAKEDVLLYPGTSFYVSEEQMIYSEADGNTEETTTSYIRYPLNPNVLQLSLYYANEDILEQRKFLDERLSLYFSLEGEKFTYAVNDDLAVQVVDTNSIQLLPSEQSEKEKEQSDLQDGEGESTNLPTENTDPTPDPSSEGEVQPETSETDSTTFGF